VGLILLRTPLHSAQFWAHSAGTTPTNTYLLWELNPTNGTVVQTLTSGVTQPIRGLAYGNNYLWAHSEGTTSSNTYLIWQLSPTNGNAVRTLTSGVTQPVSGLAYGNNYLWAHSEGTTSSNTYLLWELNPTNGNVVQTLTSRVTQPISGLAFGNNYLWAHSEGTTSSNTYLLWELNPTNGSVVQTLTSGVTQPISGLAFGNNYLWAHSEGTTPSNTYLIWGLSPTNGNAVQTLASGVTQPVRGLAFQEQQAPPVAPVATAATGVSSNQFVANWNASTGATGYELDASLESSFGSFLPAYQSLDVGSATSYSVSGLNANTTYYYRVRAYNAAGTSGNSGTVSVTTLSNGSTNISSAAQITNEPTSQATAVGSSATFTVGATGTPPLYYQWQKNDINVLNGGEISGATNATLTINPASTNDVGSYTVIVSNLYGAVTSTVATLIATNGPISPWIEVAPLPVALQVPAVAGIGNTLYVAGGNGGEPGVSIIPEASLYAYNPLSNSWTTLASMPAGRYMSEGSALSNEFYLVGGWTTSPPLPNDNLWVYNPASNSWTIEANLPQLNAGGAAGTISNQLYVTTPDDGYSGYFDFLNVYDPANNSWTALAQSSEAHHDAGYGVIGNKFYVAGGENDAGVINGQLEVYDSSSNGWATLSPMPTARYGVASAALNGKLYVIGGVDPSNNILSTVESYDAMADRWAEEAPLLSGLAEARAGVVNGVIYVVGGYNGVSNVAAVEALAPCCFPSGDWTWVASGNADWYNPSSWSPSVVPTCAANILIPVGANVNLSAPVTISGTLTFAGNATMSGNVLTVASNGTLIVEGNVVFNCPLNNLGLVQGIDGGGLSLSGTWSNAGTIIETNGIINFEGSGTNDATILFSGANAFTGSLVNNGVITIASSSVIGGAGTIIGGTITVSNGASLVLDLHQTLNGVTFNGALDVGDSYGGAGLTVMNGLTLNGTLLLGNPTNDNVGTITFQGTQALGGNGTVLFGNNPANQLSVAGVLTLGLGIVVQGQNGSISAPAEILNLGVISCDVAGGAFSVSAQPFLNQGVVQGVNGGTLSLLGPWGNSGTIIETNGIINLEGWGTNDATILFSGANAGTASLVNNGVITVASSSVIGGAGAIIGGTVTVSNGASLVLDLHQTLDGVTFNGALDVGDSYGGAGLTVTNGLTLNGTLLVGNPTNGNVGTVTFQGTQTLGGNGMVIFGNNPANQLSVAGALTLEPGIVVQGQNASISASAQILNLGIISCDVAGGAFSVSAQPFLNQGVVQGVNGGTLSLLGPWSNAGTIIQTNASINPNTTLSLSGSGTNSGTMLISGADVSQSGHVVNSGTIAAASSFIIGGNGTISGGTITISNGASMIWSARQTLDGVTANGVLSVGYLYNEGDTLTVTNGLTLNGTLLVGNPTNGNTGAVIFQGTQTLGGTGTVIFGNNPANALSETVGGGLLTIGPGILVRGQNGSITSPAEVLNAGAISCDVNSGTINVSAEPFLNQSLVQGINGGAVSLSDAWNNGGTLNAQMGTISLNGDYTFTGGTLEIGISGTTNFGVIQFGSSAPFNGLALNVNLEGGFVPAASNLFAIITYGSESGVFPAPNLPSNVLWQTTYGPTAFTLTALGVRPFTPTNTGTWTEAAPLPLALEGPAVAAIGGTLYVAGGNAGTPGVNIIPEDSLYAYNPLSNIWTSLASMPGPRYSGSGTGVTSNQFYLVGGWTTSPPLPNNNLWIYNPPVNAWAIEASLPNLNAGGVCGVVNDNLYVTTPYDGYTGFIGNWLQVYSPSANQWSQLASSSSMHAGGGGGVINGRLYVAGGVNNSGIIINTLEVYDPDSNSWVTKSPMPTSRADVASAILNGRLYVFGGADAQNQVLNTVESYDPTVDKWTTETPMPTARSDASAGAVNGVIYVVGGTDGVVNLATNEVFTPAMVQPGIITNLSIPAGLGWVTVNPQLNAIYLAGGNPGALPMVQVDGSTFNQTILGDGGAVAVDLTNNNYWSVGVYSGTASVWSDDNSDLMDISLGYCPVGVSIDAPHRRVWVSAQCGAGNDPIWAINADTGTIEAGPIGSGGVMGSILASPATGRCYVYTCCFPTGASERVDPSTFALTATSLGLVLGVNPALDILYAAAASNTLQIINGAPEPEVILTNVTLPFPFGSYIGVNPVLNRIYVGSSGSNMIAVLDGGSGQFLETISLGSTIANVGAITVDASQSRVYALASSSSSDYLYVIQDTSNSVQTTTWSAPQITNQPASQIAISGGAATLEVRATGTAPLYYQWEQNGTNLANGGEFAGASNAVLTIDPVSTADGGSYTVVVSNALGSVTSSVAIMTVLSNLVVNGGFETGDLTGWNESGPYLSVETAGFREGLVPHSGTYYLAFGPPSDSFISQTITDQAGTFYMLSYWVLGNVTGVPSDVHIYWNGSLVGSLNLVPQQLYTQYSVTVIGTGSDVLEFGLADGPGYDALDDISLLMATPAFASATQTNSMVGFAWNVIPGQTYQVQYSTNLAQTNWLDFGGQVTTTGTALTFYDSATNLQRFYRLVLQY